MLSISLTAELGKNLKALVLPIPLIILDEIDRGAFHTVWGDDKGN